MLDNNVPIPIKIRNLGALKNADIKLKPLTIFVGENNTGKTYTAYLISFIFSKYAYNGFMNEYTRGNLQEKFFSIENIVDQIFEKGHAKLNFKLFLEKNSKKYFKLICSDISPKYFKTFLGSDTLKFDNIGLNLDFKNFKETQFHNLSQRLLDDINGDLCKKCAYFDNCQNCEKTPKSESVNCNVNKENLIITFKKNKTDITKNEIKRYVSSTIFSMLHKSIFNEVYFLGAERTGLTLFYYSEQESKKKESPKTTAKKNSSSSTQAEKSVVKIQVSQPVVELLTVITKILSKDFVDVRIDKANTDDIIKKYQYYADILESEILKGEIRLNDNENVRRLIFKYSENSDVDLNMTISSSAVKGLSPLVLFLRYYLDPNELIVLDEPEMNLHPKAQVQLIELISMLVNSGINVIITTHSPYIVDHLINLIKAESSTKSKDKLVDLFYLKKKEAFISKEKVSVYLFENGDAHDILENQGDINWKTFSKVSEDITDIYFELED
ncbi:MAG: AAA family ATPase [Tissierellales bacterium]|nr:AAA family ATPase [Tissierellales bacterium]